MKSVTSFSQSQASSSSTTSSEVQPRLPQLALAESELSCSQATSSSSTTSGENIAVQPRLSQLVLPESELSCSQAKNYEEPAIKRRSDISMFMDKVSAKENDSLQLLWAQSLYTNNWAFNGVTNPIWQEFFRRPRPGWQPPSAYKISHKLLDDTTSQIQEINGGLLAKASNLTVMLDGWTDVNNTSLVNVAIYAGVPLFVKSIQPGPQSHDAEFIANAIIERIEKTPVGRSCNIAVDVNNTDSGIK